MTTEKLAADVAAIDSNLAAKRAGRDRFAEMQRSATAASDQAAADQAAALLAGDDAKLAAAEEVESRGIRDARNAQRAADLVAAEISALEGKLAEARGALAAKMERDRVAAVKVALGGLAEALGDHLGRVAAIASESEQLALAHELARALGPGLAGGYVSGKNWRPTEVEAAVLAVIGTLDPRPTIAPMMSWDGIDLGPDVGIGALRRFEFMGRSEGRIANAGDLVSVPRKVAERLAELGGAVILKPDGPFSAGELARYSELGQTWRSGVRGSAPLVVLGHPSRWPTELPPAFSDRPPTRPPGGINHAVARSQALGNGSAAQ